MSHYHDCILMLDDFLSYNAWIDFSLFLGSYSLLNFKRKHFLS